MLLLAVFKRARHSTEHFDCAGLVQRIVAIAALGRLDARWATGFALAGGDSIAGRANPLREGLVATVGESCTTRVPVVNKNGGLLGIGVHDRGNTADIPAVAGGNQRQHADSRMLGCVESPRCDVGDHTPRAQAGLGHCVGHGARDQTLRRVVKFNAVENLAGIQATKIGSDLMKNLDLAGSDL